MGKCKCFFPLTTYLLCISAAVTCMTKNIKMAFILLNMNKGNFLHLFEGKYMHEMMGNNQIKFITENYHEF